MKAFLYFFLKLFGYFIPNILFTNFLFFYNSIRLNHPFYFQRYKNPRTFNEKINFLKFFVRNPLSPLVADKFKVRDYIATKIGDQYLIPLIGVYDNIEEVDFENIPEKFIIKLNNGSGYNYICTDKNNLQIDKVKYYFKSALKVNIFHLSREWHYKLIKPRIIVEKLLSVNLLDYKVFCNEKGPFMIQVDIDRFTGHKRNLFDLNWNLLSAKIRYNNSDLFIEKPVNLDLMLKLATTLSKDFVFCRIDFYDFNGNVFFGEITLHPGGGVEPFDSYNSDLEIGKHIMI